MREASWIPSITSSTWYITSPEARCGRPFATASAMSATPRPRLFSAYPKASGTSTHSFVPFRSSFTGPPKVFGSGTARLPSVP